MTHEEWDKKEEEVLDKNQQFCLFSKEIVEVKLFTCYNCGKKYPHSSSYCSKECLEKDMPF